MKNNKFKTKKEKFEVLLALTIGKVNSYNANLFHINSHPLFKNINNNNVFIQVDIPASNNKNSAKCNTTYNIKKDGKNFRSKKLGKIKAKNINIIVTNDIASTQKELANAITNNLYKKQDNWDQWVNTQVDSISQEEIDQKLFEAYCCNANISNNNAWDAQIISACNTIKPMILDIQKNNISYTLKDFIDKEKLKHTIDSDDILTNNDKEIVVQELLKYLIMQINCYDTLKSLLDDCIDNNPVINNNMEETNSTTSIDNIDNNNNKIITNKLKNNNAMWQPAPNKSYALQEMKQIVDNNSTLQNDVNKSNISIINNQLDEDKDIEPLLINSVLQIIEIIKQPDITCNKLYNKILHIIIGTRKKLCEFSYETLDVHNDVFQSCKKNILQLLRNNTLINNFTKDILNGKFVLGTKITRDTVNSLKTQELKEIFEEINNNQSTIYKKPEEEIYIDDYK